MIDRETLPNTSAAPAGFAAGSPASASPAEIAPPIQSAGQQTREFSDGELYRPAEAPLPVTLGEVHEFQVNHDVESASPTSQTPHADAARVIEQIEQVTERMRAQSGERVELRLPLQEGGEIVVRLRLEAGQLKAVFQTEAGELRDALEAGWQQFAASSSERSLKVGEAIFESPSLQSQFSGFSQSPDQRSRQQAFATPESGMNLPVKRQSAAQPGTGLSGAPAIVPLPANAGLQLYA